MNTKPERHVFALRQGDRLAHYEIVGTLGAGGMGEVYRARDTSLGRDVAIKLLPRELATDPLRIARFRREASAAAGLTHPNICTVHEIGEVDGQLFIAMECVEGSTLDAYVKTTPLTVDQILDIGVQLADALEAARGKHVVHRDLKSANIVMTPRGDVKILDFGLAKQIAGDVPDSTTLDLTEPGMVVGTLGYMAPEHVRGGAADHRSDLFALGVVLYELLTGRRPFEGSSGVDVLRALVHDAPPSIPRFNSQAPDALVRVVMKLLEKDPEQRYQSAHDVRNDLRRLRNERGTTAPENRDADSGRAFPTRRWAVAISVLLAALGVAWAVTYVRRSNPVARRASVVMLPAKVYGAEEYAYLTDAVPATLSAQLAQVPGLDTKVPPSSFEIEKIGGDLRRVAELYDVATCVLSSITSKSQQFVLTVQLVEPRSRRVWWSHDYEGPREKYLDLVRRAADGLREALVPSSSAGAPEQVTANSEAELAFRRGQHHRYRFDHLRDPDDFKRAGDSMSRALELDPTLSEAAAEMFYLYSTAFQAGSLAAPEAFSKMQMWASKALALDDRSGPGWSALAAIEWFKGPIDPRVQLSHALSGARFGPRCGDCQHLLAVSISRSSVTLGLAALAESRRLAPLSTVPIVNIAISLLSLGRSREALTVVQEAFEIEPKDVEAQHYKALVLIDLERRDEAMPLVRQLESEVAAKRLTLSEWLGLQLAAAEVFGDRDAASGLLARILNLVRDGRVSAWEMSNVEQDTVPYIVLGHKLDEAFEILTRGIQMHVVPPYDWLLLNPHLAALRSDRRFETVLVPARAQFEAMKAVLDEARSRGDLPRHLDEAVAGAMREVPNPGAPSPITAPAR